MMTVLFGDQKKPGGLFPRKRQESCQEKNLRDDLCHTPLQWGKRNDKLSRDYINFLSTIFFSLITNLTLLKT